MKLSIILLLGLLCFGKSESLKLIKATSYKWSSGVQGLRGTKYNFVFIAGQSSEELTIENVWVGNQNLDFKAFKFGENAQYRDFEKNDTILISCESVINSKINQENRIEKPVPKYKGVALIVYQIGKKEKSFVIDKITSSNQHKYQ